MYVMLILVSRDRGYPIVESLWGGRGYGVGSVQMCRNQAVVLGIFVCTELLWEEVMGSVSHLGRFFVY